MVDYVIGTYTNKVKGYCDKRFIDNLYQVSQGMDVFVIDNTPGYDYNNRLFDLCGGYRNIAILHQNVEREPVKTLFHRNVTDSVSLLRRIFLSKKARNLVIIESDVIPPVDLLDTFTKTILSLPDQWGILGGLYYAGFHDYTKSGIQQTHHVLSGCTVYKRELIEKYPFRYDPENLVPFPDAWICYDAGKEYQFFNNHDIKCEHLHADNGSRQEGAL